MRNSWRIFLLAFFLTGAFYTNSVIAQTRINWQGQSTGSVSLGNVRSLQSRNRAEVSLEKTGEFKNTLRGNYTYADLNRRKNMDEIYLGNFSKFYFKKNLRALVVGETESSFMRGVLNRTNLGIGAGIDTRKGWDFSNVIFIEKITWVSREVQVIRNSFRVETEHNLKERVSLKTQVFLQPHIRIDDFRLKSKYSRASGTATLSVSLHKSLDLTGVLNFSWEQWVPEGRRKEDLAFTLGVTYKRK